MAVVSAKNDYANQIILQKCREIDPKGHRTLGIITKPDFLEPDSENELSWMELAKNKDIFLQLGWHMLKNRSDKEASKSFSERNSAESAFFSKGRYRDLPKGMLGIAKLRTRLSELLFKHLKTELPSLRKELNEKLKDVDHEIRQLGEKRSTEQEQRQFLLKASSDYVDIVKAAADGRYDHEFFGDMEPDEPLIHESNMRRIRAVVQYLNLEFATAMRMYGHASEIKGEGVVPLESASQEDPELDEGYAQFAEHQTQVDREDEIKRVRKILARSRGRELPGTFNPLLISQLFWAQSANWKAIAEYHVYQVAHVCSELVDAAIDFCVPSDVASRLQTLKVDATLNSRLTKAKEELEQIITDAKHHPITYDPAYMNIVQEKRYEKQTSKLKQLAKQAEVEVWSDDSELPEKYLKPDILHKSIGQLIEPDMDRVSAEDALDCQQAYYKEEVKYFISAVTKQVIERHLLQGLDTQTVSPVLVGAMSEDEIAYVAAEAPEITAERENLEARKATLEKGREAFRSALGLFK